MKKLVIASLLIVYSFLLNAQEPQGYYNSAAGLYGVPLQQALHDIIDDHTVISYDDLIDVFESTDVKPNGKVWDMYSDIPGGTPPYEFTFGSDQCGSYNGEGDCFNREHSWPKSWFNDKSPMYSDVFHLYPTDGYVNNRRSNYPYGKVGSAEWTSQNGSKLGDCATTGYSGTVFEPIDAYKGDFARSYFYMATRYYKEDSGWGSSGMTNGSQLKPWAVTMLLQWDQLDPVSQKEIDRNNIAYTFQHNRNPFIDHPEFAPDIWAPNAGMGELERIATLPAFPNPCKTTCKIELPGEIQKHNLEVFVYSVSGKKLTVPFTQLQGVVEVHTAGLAPGIYMLDLNDNESNTTFHCRIVRQ